MTIRWEGNVKERLTAEEVAVLEQQDVKLQAFLGPQPRGEFEPSAFYDAELDCIRVLIKDCSACEVRINEYLTVLQDNDPIAYPYPIGFNLKGVRAKSLAGVTPVISLTAIFDELAKRADNSEFLYVVQMLREATEKANVNDEVEADEAADDAQLEFA